jgi:hypothetical protein
MTYFLQVKPKLTSWLVATLLALAAVQFASASCSALPCPSYGTVRADRCLVKRNVPRLFESSVFRRAQSLPPSPEEDLAGSNSRFLPNVVPTAASGPFS